MINLPLCRAKKIDSDEWVEGWYYKSVGGFHCMCYYDKDLEIDWEDKIDPSTLLISFNNGKSWLRLKDLEVHTCTDFDLTYSDMKYRSKYINQPPNGSIFTIVTDKGR